MDEAIYIGGICVGMPPDEVLARKGAPVDDTGKVTEIVEVDKGHRPLVVRFHYSDVVATLRHSRGMWRVSELAEVGADESS